MHTPCAQEPPARGTEASGRASSLRGGLSVLLLAGLMVVWCLLIRRFGEGNVYAVVGPYACAVCALSVATDPRHTLAIMRPRLRPILIGLALGVLMTVLTYPVFKLARDLVPGLDGAVEGLYRGARSTTLPRALGWVVAIIFAEELLFRGAFPRALRRFVPERPAYALSLLCYVLAQLGTGSLIVGLLALVCGAVWTTQRVLTGSLLSPLIAHLIWSPTVILLHPVT